MKKQSNLLCKLTLLDSERHEILQAYELTQLKRHPYPTIAVQMLAHNVRNGAEVCVYRSFVPDVLAFAQSNHLNWLEQRITDAYRADRDARERAH